MHTKQIETKGKPVDKAQKVMIMLHGRGASARDILGLSDHLSSEGFAFLAPQASNHTWYPYSFLAPPAQNQPWLDSALMLLKETVDELLASGFSTNQLYFLGFSQGACLTLEFVTRHAARYGGVIAFTGGLIGDQLYPANYQGDFQQTPILIGTSDPDPHVPVSRVNESAKLLQSMNAKVDVRIYPGMGHTINADEIAVANEILLMG